MSECVVCGSKPTGFLYIIGLGEEFPICESCALQYGVKNIQKAITGLFMLAVAKKKKNIKMAWDAGFYIGAAPEVFALMSVRGLTINLQVVGLDQVKITDINWDYRKDPDVNL